MKGCGFPNETQVIWNDAPLPVVNNSSITLDSLLSIGISWRISWVFAYSQEKVVDTLLPSDIFKIFIRGVLLANESGFS